MQHSNNKIVDNLELAATFPEAKTTLKRLCAEDKKKIMAYNSVKNKIKSDIMFKVKPDLVDFVTDLLMTLHATNKQHIIKRGRIFNQVLDVEDRLKKNQAILNFIENKGSAITNWEQDVNKARAVLIPSLIKINRANFAKCIWHNEKTASLKYYPKSNSVYCFGCGHYDDSIGVVQQLMSYSFKDAVKWLISRG